MSDDFTLGLTPWDNAARTHQRRAASESTFVQMGALILAGWHQSSTGRWYHDAFPGTHGRRRLFTTPDALALLDADPMRTALANEDAR